MNRSSIVNNKFLRNNSYDIISNIFLYLSQQDCLNCMATCREWYDDIPQFTQANWKTLQLNEYGITRRQERNLGKHVQHVSFEFVPENLLSKMMQILLDCGCTEIESLDFTNCKNGSSEKEHNDFLNRLRRLALHQLTHLAMMNNNWNSSILDLLFVCPHLTHFSYIAGSNHFRNDDVYRSPLIFQSSQALYNTLIHLHVNSDSPSIKCDVQTIISRSPNLRYFIGSRMLKYDPELDTLIPAEFVLPFCPRLEYYVGDGSYDYDRELVHDPLKGLVKLKWPPATADNNYSNGIKAQRRQQQQQGPFHSLSICYHHNATGISFLLQKYRDTLKHLRIYAANSFSGGRSSNSTNTFQIIPMQQLRSLWLESLNYDMGSIVTLLNTCCSTIQEVQLYPIKSMLLDTATFQALKTLPHLRTLGLTLVHFADEVSVTTLLKRLPSLERLAIIGQGTFALPEQAIPFLRNLKQLTLLDIHTFAGSGTPVLSPGLLRSLAQDGSKLDSITLKGGTNNEISFEVLNALATLPSLKNLSVDGIENFHSGKVNEEEEEQNLLQLFNQFIPRCDNNRNNNIRAGTTSASASAMATTTAATNIEVLALSHVYKVTYTMLNKLGELTNLQDIDITLSASSFASYNILPLSLGSQCLNLDLAGLVELFRKGKKLRRATFRRVLSFGQDNPFYYLRRTLFEEQPDVLEVWELTINLGTSSGFSRPFFESTLQIINNRL